MSKYGTPLTLPKLSPLCVRHTWVLTEEWSCFGYEIPVGFLTDLDSVPHIPILFTLFKGRARWSAVFHDYHYTICELPRKDVDDMFLEAMLLEGVPKFLAKSMHLGVRAFGWYRWNKCAKKPVEQRMKDRFISIDTLTPCHEHN